MCPDKNEINAVTSNYRFPAQCLPQAYAQQACLASSISDDDDICSSSIFGGMNGMGLGGAMPGLGGGLPFMGYGYGPGSEIMGMTQEKYLEYQSKLKGDQLHNQLSEKRKTDSFNFEYSAAEDVITRRVGTLQRRIQDNDQDKIYAEYLKLKEVAKAKLIEDGHDPKELNAQQVRAYAEKLYFKETGVSIVEDLQANGDSGFAQGMKQGVLGGVGSIFANETNYKENLQKITGEEMGNSEKYWKTAGQWTSGIVTTGVALITLPWLLKGGAAGAKAGGGTFAKGWKSLFGIGKAPKAAAAA